MFVAVRRAVSDAAKTEYFCVRRCLGEAGTGSFPMQSNRCLLIDCAGSLRVLVEVASLVDVTETCEDLRALAVCSLTPQARMHAACHRRQTVPFMNALLGLSLNDSEIIDMCTMQEYAQRGWFGSRMMRMLALLW